MQKWRMTVAVSLAILCLPMLLGQGCPSAGPNVPTTNPPTVSDLTAAERAAIDSVNEGCGAIGQATHTTQNASGGGASGQMTPADATSWGTCPVVTTSVSTTGGLALSINMNFGTAPGCTIPGYESYVWSGSASGSFSTITQNIQLTFNNVTCNQDSLNGTVAAQFTIDNLAIGLTGDFDLTWISGTDNVGLVGSGVCNYSRTTYTTTVSSFNGTLIDPAGTYQATLTGVAVSYLTNGNLIPSAGTATVSSPGIRNLTVKFDSTSPGTGEVQVSINGGPFFTVNLYTL